MNRIARVARIVASVVFATSTALAQVPNNHVVDFSLPTTGGATRSVSGLRGRVVVVFYEDKDGAETNQRFKTLLGNVLRRDPALASTTTTVGVANLGDYNSWPARGFAEDAVKENARTAGVEIWMDWEHQLSRSVGLFDHNSNVLVLDRRGRARLHRWGRLSEADAAQVVGMLRTLAREN